VASYHIDDVTLRDEPDDLEAAWAHVRSLEPGGERVVWLRMLGELDRAEAMGWQLLAAAGGPGSLAEASRGVGLPVDALAPAVRLAHVLHWQERFRDADVLFSAVIASATQIAAASAGSPEQRRATTMLAFALQHLGKSRFDENRPVEALDLFEQAYALRQRLGVPDDQLASSRQAIAAARARRAASAGAGGAVELGRGERPDDSVLGHVAVQGDAEHASRGPAKDGAGDRDDQPEK
jgi:hypothetical protein